MSQVSASELSMKVLSQLPHGSTGISSFSDWDLCPCYVPGSVKDVGNREVSTVGTAATCKEPLGRDRLTASKETRMLLVCWARR